ncbi:MAG: dephospho-CoA kinase [Bacteroidales bacterium]
MKKAGLAGGIGSGKSNIARAFEILGVPVYYADPEARRLMHSEEMQQAINQALQTNVFHEGRLDKQKMSDIIFNDEDARRKVNNIVHPAVHKDFEQWAARQSAPLVLVEASIMFETGFYKKLDATILVLADEKERLERVMQRDNADLASVMERVKSQKKPEMHKNLATYLISNNNKDEVLPQILYIYNSLIYG